MKINNILSNITKSSPGDSLKHLNRLSSDPHVDWAFIVASSAILFIVLAGVGYWTLGQVSTRINSTATDKLAVVTKIFDEQKLNNVLGEFDSRSQEWVKLKDGDYSFTGDPSL